MFFFCGGGREGGPLRFSHDVMFFFFKSDFKGWVVPLPTNSQHKDRGSPAKASFATGIPGRGMSPNSTDNTTLEVRKKQDLVSRFGIWILSYSVFISECLESIKFCFKILSEHRVPSFEQGKKNIRHTIPFSIHFGRNKSKPTINTTPSLPPPPQKKSSFQQNHNIWTAPLEKKPLNKPTQPTSPAAVGGLKVATTPIMFSTTPGWDIIVITGMWSTAAMFLAEHSDGASSQDFDGYVTWLITGWWLNQPSWKILVKLDHLPQIGMKIKDIWNHHPDDHG